jgi:hypothetical protein
LSPADHTCQTCPAAVLESGVPAHRAVRPAQGRTRCRRPTRFGWCQRRIRGSEAVEDQKGRSLLGRSHRQYRSVPELVERRLGRANRSTGCGGMPDRGPPPSGVMARGSPARGRRLGCHRRGHTSGIRKIDDLFNRRSEAWTTKRPAPARMVDETWRADRALASSRFSCFSRHRRRATEGPPRIGRRSCDGRPAASGSWRCACP